MKPAREIISAIFDEQIAQRAESYSGLFSGWKSVAGENIAAHSKVIDVKHGALLVEVDHAGWIQMIRLRESHILGELRKRYSALDIRQLKIRVAAEPATGERTAPPPRNQEQVEELRDVNSEEYQEFRSLLERVNHLGDRKKK